jgi:hypothetical protein
MGEISGEKRERNAESLYSNDSESDYLSQEEE